MAMGNRLEEAAEVTCMLQDENHTVVQMFVRCNGFPFFGVGIVDASGAEGVRLAREKALLDLRRKIDAQFEAGADAVVSDPGGRWRKRGQGKNRMAQLSLANWQDFNLDENIVPLVLELARLPGIITTSSCGGHASPRPNSGQYPAGEWFVSFTATRDAAGLATLIRVLSVAKDVELEIEWPGGSGNARKNCYCHLIGTADPAQVAALLQRARATSGLGG